MCVSVVFESVQYVRSSRSESGCSLVRICKVECQIVSFWKVLWMKSKYFTPVNR